MGLDALAVGIEPVDGIEGDEDAQQCLGQGLLMLEAVDIGQGLAGLVDPDVGPDAAGEDAQQQVREHLIVAVGLGVGGVGIGLLVLGLTVGSLAVRSLTIRSLAVGGLLILGILLVLGLLLVLGILLILRLLAVRLLIVAHGAHSFFCINSIIEEEIRIGNPFR